MYFLTDQVESVKVVVNDQGLPVSRTEYLPYGETWFQEGENGHTAKYNSQELDKESGFHFYNARHYDSEICRFVTADSVIDGATDSQGWNRYMYVRGNPIRYMDPTGHAVWEIVIAVITFLKETGGWRASFPMNPGFPNIDIKMSKDARIVYALICAILKISAAAGASSTAIQTAQNVADWVFNPVGKAVGYGVSKLYDMWKDKLKGGAKSGVETKGGGESSAKVNAEGMAETSSPQYTALARTEHGGTLPIAEETNYRIQSAFGNRQNPFTGIEEFHEGIDIAVPEGTPAYVTRDGTVVKTYTEGDGSGYGNGLIVRHADNTYSLVAHNSQVLVQEGQNVSAGDQIALSGDTGASTGPHIHYEIVQGTRGDTWNVHWDRNRTLGTNRLDPDTFNGR